MKSGRISSYGLNGNALKIIAVISMLIDHIGVVLFPNVTILRIIGRIAFPVFAFMIAEGCAYTKNKMRYFLTIFILGMAYQGVYYIYTKEHYIGILIAFSVSILVIYALEYFKNTIFEADGSFLKQSLAFVILLFIIIIVYILNDNFESDYGFWGAMAPVFASLFRKPLNSNSELYKKLDNNVMHVLMLSMPLVFVALIYGGTQPYSLFAIPLLLFYSGKRGKLKLKYFFYIFYPVHLVALEAISFFS